MAVETLERPQVRTLAHVLLDLKEVKAAEAAAYRRSERAAAENDREAEDRAGDEGAEIDRRIEALQAEFKSTAGKLLGLPWAQVETAIYDGLL